jgi:hypothetical protein
MCGAQGGICRVNTFFNHKSCCFLYKAKDLSAPSLNLGHHRYANLLGTYDVTTYKIFNTIKTSGPNGYSICLRELRQDGGEGTKLQRNALLSRALPSPALPASRRRCVAGSWFHWRRTRRPPV